ncbi:MAG TPA: plastocyanin/azurin family copper-binding protein [Gemmatimonadales bacterium]|nr:plastocyanin/azurin family copper-binding protein [Gemmatimonadales bacterium]
MNTRHLALAAAALLLTACSSDKITQPPAGSVITISDFNFTPDSIAVPKGTIVEWDNAGPSAHNVSSDSSKWTAVTLSPPSGGNAYGGGTAGGTFRLTFDSAGTFRYHCTIHGFAGVVVVTP